MVRSLTSTPRPKMYACLGLVMCFVVGSTLGYYPQRVVPYYTGANDPYSVEVSPQSFQEPSQRLFWGSQGSNQVGGTGFWAHLTNKFPFLGNMFGKLELPSEYGVPNQNNVPSTQYGVPGLNQAQYYQQQQQQQHFYQKPQFYTQPQQFYQQVPQQPGQRSLLAGRDVGITDDAIIVTPPFVPPVAQPAPAPVPVPVPAPVRPVAVPEPVQGYAYNKPQYRLELPHK